MNKGLRLRGFTLVELLTVIAIITVLSAVAVPAISSLGVAGDTNQAVNGISQVMEESRAYAMSHDTYVWVGFAQDTTAHKVTVGIVAGTVGQSSDISSATTYSAIEKPQNFQRLALAAVDTLTNVAGVATTGDDITTTSTFANFQMQSGSSTLTFKNVIQFSPQGEVTVKSTGSSRWIEIGVQPLRGGVSASPDVAVVQVGGLTGQVQIFRP